MTAQAARDPLERRQAARIPVALPVELESGKGITQDVSTSGVLFETEISHAPGSPISLSLLLEHVDPSGPLRVHCRGKVVRVRRFGGKLHVAVALEAYRLEPAETGLRGVAV